MTPRDRYMGGAAALFALFLGYNIGAPLLDARTVLFVGGSATAVFVACGLAMAWHARPWKRRDVRDTWDDDDLGEWDDDPDPEPAPARGPIVHDDPERTGELPAVEPLPAGSFATARALASEAQRARVTGTGAHRRQP